MTMAENHFHKSLFRGVITERRFGQMTRIAWISQNPFRNVSTSILAHNKQMAWRLSCITMQEKQRPLRTHER